MRWSPDSRHVLTAADFNIRMTVWSLTDKSAVPIPMPYARAIRLRPYRSPSRHSETIDACVGST